MNKIGLIIMAILMGVSILSQAQKVKNTVERNELGEFTLPQLPYSKGALAQVISERTMTLHYNKHFQGYITKLNELIKGTKMEKLSLEEIVMKSDGAIFNNAGQALNHAIYFSSFSPNGRREPSGTLKTAIDRKWGSFNNFKKEFMEVANGLFGSGWAWLSKTRSGDLVITSESNAGNPVKSGNTPLLGIDVWEHSYYLDYENRRAEHLNKIWDILDWNVIEARY